ncbi:MAG: hypothetical protein NTW87_36735 [Planctomycetota bacterium]|nr:hypothetical protein [Planctomycetota bacterium]
MPLRGRCSALLCVLCALCGEVSAADFPIGPDAQVDSLAVAASASNYLVVWRDVTQPAAPRVMGATVTTTGVAATAFPISDAAGVPLESPVQRATVAFDGTRFLVVWADNRTGGAGIRGALVTQAGSVAGADVLIAPVSRTNDLAPQAVFTGTDYLVAWQDNAPSSDGAASRIFYARVTTAGAAGPVGGLPFTAGQNQSLEFLVAGAGGETAIIVHDTGADPHVTRAVRLAADSSFVGPPEGVLLFKEDFSVTGFGTPVGAAYAETGTAGTGGEYAVLSSYSPTAL